MLSTGIKQHVEVMDRGYVSRERVLFWEGTRRSLPRQTSVSAFLGEGESHKWPVSAP